MNEICLGKYDFARVTIGGKNIILCGTPMAFDDIIQQEVTELLCKLTHDLLGENVSTRKIEEDYQDYLGDLAYEVIKAMEAVNNFKVKYQYEEY